MGKGKKGVLTQVFTKCYFLKETTKENLTQKGVVPYREQQGKTQKKRCCSLEGTIVVPCREQQRKCIRKLLFLRGNDRCSLEGTTTIPFLIFLHKEE